MQNATTPRSCGTRVCASFISAMDDRKFALVRAGLQVRACRVLSFGIVPAVVRIPCIRAVRASVSLPLCKHERGHTCEHVRVSRNVLATRPTHSMATVTGCPSGTTSSSGNILPNIAACPLVYLSGPITQPWHERQRACVGARACSSPHASVRALIHSHRLFHARILPPQRGAGVARGRVHACARVH